MAETTSKVYDWKALVTAHEGAALNERPVEYEFSQGRQFKAPAEPYQSDIPQEPAP